MRAADTNVNGPKSSLVEMLEQRKTAMTVEEVASVLNVSKRSIYRLAAQWKLAYFRVAGSIRFDPATIAAVIRRNAPLR